MAKRIFIDVREEYEYLMGHLRDAINLPLSKLSASGKKMLEEIEQDAELVIYCRSGARASVAVSIFKGYGYNAVNGVNQQECQRTYKIF